MNELFTDHLFSEEQLSGWYTRGETYFSEVAAEVNARCKEEFHEALRILAGREDDLVRMMDQKELENSINEHHRWIVAAIRATMQAQIDTLQQWKDSATAVMDGLDDQRLASLLGAKLGESTYAAINREVPLLLEGMKIAETELAELRKGVEWRLLRLHEVVQSTDEEVGETGYIPVRREWVGRKLGALTIPVRRRIIPQAQEQPTALSEGSDATQASIKAWTAAEGLQPNDQVRQAFFKGWTAALSWASRQPAISDAELAQLGSEAAVQHLKDHHRKVYWNLCIQRTMPGLAFSDVAYEADLGARKAFAKAVRAALQPQPERKEPCSRCGKLVSDWVDPNWANGRICRECETLHERAPTAPTTNEPPLPVRSKEDDEARFTAFLEKCATDYRELTGREFVWGGRK